ncbi:MAG: lysophospholipid acyltransferase family protein [Calditerrivibrio sp.]|nr:lysophospholipid acyltransferase family protein [Calditerrivibrio sp.]
MNKILIYIFVVIIKLLIKTVRFEIHGLDTYKDLKARGERVIFAIWHGQLALFYPMSKYSKACGIVSRSRDGEIAANIIKYFGFDSVRGSSSRAGAMAILEAEKYLKEDFDIIITIDGPKGPKFDVKKGVIYIAKRFDCVIIPVVASVDRFLRFSSWDNFLFPKPFAKIDLFLGDPYITDKDIDKSKIKAETDSLKAKMLNMTERYAKFYL